MKKYKLLCLTVALFAIVGIRTASAQMEQSHIEVDGARVDGNSYSLNTEIEGSPFLNDDWEVGTAISDKGDVYKVKLKYDIHKDQPIFAGKDDGAMMFTVPIAKFTIGDKVFANGLPANGSLKSTSYYQIFGNGNTKLLRRYIKKVVEIRDVSGVITNRKFDDDKDYYLFKDGKVALIKLNKSNVLNVLSDKKDQMDAYFKSNKVDFKSDGDLTKLIDYYNGLK